MLFADSHMIGTFKGFNERGLEFAAEIIAPYDGSMLDKPQLGQFVLIEMGSLDEAALGRITRFVPSGLLATAEGEDYVNTMQRRKQQVPEDLKQQRLKYRVQVKLLGTVREIDDGIVYVPSQRRLPHLGAAVAFPSDAVLQELCRLSGGVTELGTYVLGEFDFCGSGSAVRDKVLRPMDPELKVFFDISKLVSKRSFVFARAGYGKSNLMKLLVSELYKEQPKTASGLPVGTLIFDANGEYFWPDPNNNRPGFCDIPHLRDKLVVFTNRKSSSPYYGSWKAGDVKLDLRLLPAGDVIGVAISPDRQQNQNVLKLKSMGRANWAQIVDLVYDKGLGADDNEIGELLGYSKAQIQQSTAEIAAARSNMYSVVRQLHDPNSRVLDGALRALKDGAIVVIDISLLSSVSGEMLAGLVMRKIFSYNQENFTGGSGIIPVIAVIEEAQSVLGGHLDEVSPFVEWVKEGRKYDLGAILITQQPGSLAKELLSQGDNWFVFHLLSESDAFTLKHHNAHFSDDVLAHLVGEPIRGNCYMWSAPEQPFVLPVRVKNFEALYRSGVKSDPGLGPIQTYVDRLASKRNDNLVTLASRLVSRLQSTFFSAHDDADGGQILALKSGRWFYLMKECKDPADPTPEDQLRDTLLHIILGGDVAKTVWQGRDSLIGATREQWKNALGVEPRVKE